MKYFKKIVWVILGLCMALLIYANVKFQVDDMTLSKGAVYNFNSGWKLTGQDGEEILLDTLPYLGKSDANEWFRMENTIPREYWGLTMSFLSADKELKIWIDDKVIYEFGISDKRTFGHTPGSVVNFIDIPKDLTDGNIRIEMISPYADYAARLDKIIVGKRDVLILKLLKDNLINITCSFVIIICGAGFTLLYILQRISRQDTEGLQYLCGYCTVSAAYYFIETKTMHLFYGNQTLYSVFVFLCLLTMPLLMVLYYGNGILKEYKKRWLVLLGLICGNIFIQIILQILNIFDFMEMAFISHGLIMVAVLIVGKSYYDMAKQNHDKRIKMEMTAIFLMAAGGIADIVRMYIVGIGDMGKFSRLGTTAFSMLMLYKHFRQIMMGYSHNIEENARLLKNEVEYMEKRNEQLEKANWLAEEARKEALAANAAKGKFLAHMSHEIRTPINAVLGMDTMILRESKEMQIKEYALDIQNAGQNLLALINDILDFSKIESGKLEIIPVEYDFSSMIHDISNMLSAKMKAKKLLFHIKVDEQLPSKLLGDDVRIRQVLVNLLNNAVKYTNEGSVTLQISGEVSGENVILDFSVEDTGIGIKEEDISRLFEEFERIEEKRNRNIEGTGLGINITTQLLQLMGSHLKVESVYGKGSRFYFTLTQQVVDHSPIGNLEERIRKQSTEYSYRAVFTAPQARILVVDDNAINLKVFISLLKATKVNVDVADSGRACLEMVCLKHYDLIFLDHMMPDMDGVETLHHLKTLEDNLCADTPVVALTANAISGAREMYLAEGFDAFLSKPIYPEKLEQMILKLLPRELLEFDEGEKEAGEENVMTELPFVDGIDWNYGLLHLPEKELLLDTVKSFYKAIDLEADALESFYKGIKADALLLDQYRIKVHSMKNTANLIGATVLGGMAKQLEEAARAGDMKLIDALTEIFLKEWRSYKDKLSAVVEEHKPEKEAESRKEVNEDYTVILAYLEMLRIAMLELDIDAMDSAMEKLEQFIYTPDIQKDIERLSLLVNNMDSEQAVAMIKELMDKISSEGGKL